MPELVHLAIHRRSPQWSPGHGLTNTDVIPHRLKSGSRCLYVRQESFTHTVMAGSQTSATADVL
jgi:hypothetical protein